MARFLSVAVILSLVLATDPAWACRNRCRRVIIVPVARPAPVMSRADEPVLLRLKLVKGQTFYEELEIVTSQTMKVMGEELGQEHRQTFVLAWTPKGRDAQGNWQISQKIIAARIKTDIGGNKVEYDTEAGKALAASPVANLLNELRTVELVFTLDADYQIMKVNGREQLVEKFAKVSPAMTHLLDKIMSEEALKAMWNGFFHALPDKSVRLGENWSRRRKPDYGPLGIYDQTLTFRFEGRSGAFDKIAVRSDIKYEKPTDLVGLPIIIKTAHLKSSRGDGAVLYDRAKGRIASSTMNVTMQLDWVIKIGGMDTTVSVTQTQVTRSRTFDENPLRKRK